MDALTYDHHDIQQKFQARYGYKSGISESKKKTALSSVSPHPLLDCLLKLDKLLSSRGITEKKGGAPTFCFMFYSVKTTGGNLQLSASGASELWNGFRA